MMDGPVYVPLQTVCATQALAERLAPRLRKGDAVLLSGSLGAGKSTFARALILALGHQGEVPSPTFTLAQGYELADLNLTHFDLYRLQKPEEVEELGLYEALADGAVLVEWPEKAAAYMPREALCLTIEIDGQGQRRMRIEGQGEWPARIGDWIDANEC